MKQRWNARIYDHDYMSAIDIIDGFISIRYDVPGLIIFEFPDDGGITIYPIGPNIKRIEIGAIIDDR